MAILALAPNGEGIDSSALRIEDTVYVLKVVHHSALVLQAELTVIVDMQRAATGGWASSGTGRGSSHEYDPDCC